MRNTMDTPRNQIVNAGENQMPGADVSSLKSESESETELEDSQDSESDEQQPLLHTLVILKRKTIEFNTFHEIERRWDKSTGQTHITHPIDSFRDATMIPLAGQRIVLFHMRNGSVSHAELLTLETTAAVDRVTLPCHVENANFALLCHMNDRIYCFPRADQHYFHR